MATKYHVIGAISAVLKYEKKTCAPLMYLRFKYIAHHTQEKI
jgi:hypothetical protein